MVDKPDGGFSEVDLSTSLTFVRIKRRRDDPAEPEIILEAAGAQRKLPRYDEVLLQLQGLSVVNPANASSAAPRRRFRKLRTVEIDVLEGMSESELVRLLRARSSAEASTSAPTTVPAEPLEDGVVPPPAAPARAAAVAPVDMVASGVPSLTAFGAGAAGGTHQRAPTQQRSAKASRGPTQETRMAALRTSHRQTGVVARYKQFRCKRGLTSDSVDKAGGRLLMYDLERLPGGAAAQAAEAPEDSRRHAASDRPPAQQPGPRGQPSEAQETACREQPSGGAERPRPQRSGHDVPDEAIRRGATAAASEGAGAALTPEELLIRERYAPMIEEFLHRQDPVQLPQPQAQPVHPRIPARPRRAPAAPATAPAAPEPQPPPSHPEQELPVEPQGQQGAQTVTAAAGQAAPAGVELVALSAGAASSCTAASAAPPEAAGPATAVLKASEWQADGAARGASPGENERGHAFVYDVYVPVAEDEEEKEEGGECVPWVDAADPAVPVIEVAEDDDEFLWAGELGDTAARRAAEAEEHDSEDSNAESYYANSYPDEEDACYGRDAPSSDDDDGGGGGAGSGWVDGDEEGVADPDATGYGWADGVRQGVGGRGALSDDVDGEEVGDGDEEAFGRRRPRVRQQSSYYRTEDDDYSEHSSFLSEEEERREAEERRRRAIFMH